MHGTTRAEQRDGAWLIELRGEHDLATAPTVAEHLEHARSLALPVVIDLTAVEFIDSSIVAAVARTLAARDGQPSVAVVAPTGQPRGRLLLLGLDGHLPVYDNRRAALVALGLTRPMV
jgi:anti-anti-sigma factor